MGAGLTKEDKELLASSGFTNKELKALKKDFLNRASNKKNPELNKEQFKNLFRDHVGKDGAKVRVSSPGVFSDFHERLVVTV